MNTFYRTLVYRKPVVHIHKVYNSIQSVRFN